MENISAKLFMKYDCIEEMKKIPDNSVDLIFADPLYYLQLPKGKRLKRSNGTEIIPADSDWDSLKATIIMTPLLMLGLASA